MDFSSTKQAVTIDKTAVMADNVRMSNVFVPIRTLLADLLRDRQLTANRLALKLGVSHATVGRWLKGDDVPSARSCYRLAEFSGTPLETILRSAGHIPSAAYTGERQQNPSD